MPAAAEPLKAEVMDWTALKVTELRSALAEQGLPARGTKQQLISKLEATMKAEEAAYSKPVVRPGIAGIQGVATAEVRCGDNEWNECH